MFSNYVQKSRSTSTYDEINTKSRRSAFTLIELLVVVAIVAILTAIAVPNFLEAQTRSKVSRTKADLRSVATGLETYRTDYSGYPIVGNPAMPGPWDLSVPYHERLVTLTTPIAYVTSIPDDVFTSAEKEEWRGYCYAPGNFYNGANASFSGNNYRGTIYSISGLGPDRKIGAGGYCLAHPIAYEKNRAIMGAYDPTNGTVSEGDIVQLSCGRL